MNAVEFNAIIDNGKIDIPDEYLQELGSEVKIIMLYDNLDNANKKKNNKKSIKGILNKYADQELVPLEKEAWGEATNNEQLNKRPLSELRGLLKDKVWMSDDFNEPLDEMKEYME